MERSRSSKYLGITSWPSFLNFPSSFVTTNFSRATTTVSKFSKPSKTLKRSRYSKLSSHTPHHTTHYTAHKFSSKMSAPSQINPLKRPHEEDNSRPFKKLIGNDTGLDEDVTERIASPITTSERTSYIRRRQPAFMKFLKRRRAMVNQPVFPLVASSNRL